MMPNSKDGYLPPRMVIFSYRGYAREKSRISDNTKQ